jgi:nucleotide-binding universal stress UspA family protein
MAAKPIVAGTDGSEESLRAVDWAAREAALRGAPLRIVAAAALLPRMASRVGTVEYDTVTDVLLKERDRALTTAAERATRTAPARPASRRGRRGPAPDRPARRLAG